MAHLSTWYRCIAIDIPGYGRSPKADAGLTMTDMADACWEAIDDATPGERAILVGCSVGSSLAPHMYHRRPDKTAALVLSGTGYNPTKEFTQKRIDNYTADGIDYRWRYTFEDLSPAFWRRRWRISSLTFSPSATSTQTCRRSSISSKLSRSPIPRAITSASPARR